MRFPVEQPYKITQRFSSAHPGWDIAPVPAGATNVPVVAPEKSLVIASAYRADPEGHYVMLRGDSGKVYYFGHFAERLVDYGKVISEGTPIGIMGNTGRTNSGIHTHHEVRNQVSGSQVDPEIFYRSVLNSKEEAVQEKATYEWVANASQTILGRKQPMTRDAWEKSWEKGRTREEIYNQWVNSEEAKAFRFKAWDYDRLKAELDVLKSQPSQPQSEAEQTVVELKSVLAKVLK